MDELTTEDCTVDDIQKFGVKQNTPILLVAYAAENAAAVDRCQVRFPFTVGRESSCDLVLQDRKLSRRHFRIVQQGETTELQDLKSTNGTFVNGQKVANRVPLPNRSVIRIGQNLLVFLADGGAALHPPLLERLGIEGRFHAGQLLEALNETVLSNRHLLINGPSGSGKELAAKAFVALLEQKQHRSLPFVASNAARYASAEDATTTLFGVGKRVFTGVDSSSGLIARAAGGVFFLDEVHNLPQRLQRSLLRVLQENELNRIGEVETYAADVRFVLASNAPAPSYGLTQDLLARLRVVQVPSLAERNADIPSIFNYLLESALAEHGMAFESVQPFLSGDHYEALMLDKFETDNTRGLVDLADRLATRLAAGAAPTNAIHQVFSERFEGNPVAQRHRSQSGEDPDDSRYLAYKNEIIAVYQKTDGNLSATERLLKETGFHCCRPWLRKYLEQWGVRRIRSASKKN